MQKLNVQHLYYLIFCLIAPFSFSAPVIAAESVLQSDCGISIQFSLREDFPDKLLDLLWQRPDLFPCYMESISPLFRAEMNVNLQWNLIQLLSARPFLRPSQRHILEVLLDQPQIQTQAMGALLPLMSAEERFTWFVQYRLRLNDRALSDFMFYQGGHLSARDAKHFSQQFVSDIEAVMERSHEFYSIKYLCHLLQYTDSPLLQVKLVSLMDRPNKWDFIRGAGLLREYTSEIVQKQVSAKIVESLLVEKDLAWISEKIRALDILAVGEVQQHLLNSLRAHQVPEVQLMATHFFILQEQPTQPAQVLAQLLTPEVMSRSASPEQLAESILRQLAEFQYGSNRLSVSQLTELQNQPFSPSVKKVTDEYLQTMRQQIQ